MSAIKKDIFFRWFVTIVRMSVGWHFLYEGYSKLMLENWTAKGYLMGTTGLFSDFYHYLAESPMLPFVDKLNVYGLCIIGIMLFCGFCTRYAACAGSLLLLLYYFAYPPFGVSILGQENGNLFIVDKIFLEILLLLLLVISKKYSYGVSSFIFLIRNYYQKRTNNKEKVNISRLEQRRELIKNLTFLPALTILGYGGLKRKFDNVDALSGATIKLNTIDLGTLKGDLPKGKIGNVFMSRLVAGGNLILGSSHARDLLYVNSLVKAYNTEKKIFETLMLAEQVGIDTINIGFLSGKLMAKYKKLTGSKMQVITQVSSTSKNNDIYEQINKAIDEGADIVQINGQCTDRYAEERKLDVIVKMLDKIKGQGYIAGLGAHDVHTFIETEAYGIRPDYYMKTMHHDDYWSAHPRNNRRAYETNGKKSKDHNMFHDNLFCVFPDQTIEFVNNTTIPVMGFKVLAAGAIKPEDGFHWAFKNGADFICVGMFDYQLVDDVNVCIDVLNNLTERKRAWYS